MVPSCSVCSGTPKTSWRSIPACADCSRDSSPPRRHDALRGRGPGRETQRRQVHALERSEEHTSELQSRLHLVCRLLLEKKKKKHQLFSNVQTIYAENWNYDLAKVVNTRRRLTRYSHVSHRATSPLHGAHSICQASSCV